MILRLAFLGLLSSETTPESLLSVSAINCTGDTVSSLTITSISKELSDSLLMLRDELELLLLLELLALDLELELSSES